MEGTAGSLGLVGVGKQFHLRRDVAPKQKLQLVSKNESRQIKLSRITSFSLSFLPALLVFLMPPDTFIVFLSLFSLIVYQTIYTQARRATASIFKKLKRYKARKRKRERKVFFLFLFFIVFVTSLSPSTVSIKPISPMTKDPP